MEIMHTNTEPIQTNANQWNQYSQCKPITTNGNQYNPMGANNKPMKANTNKN